MENQMGALRKVASSNRLLYAVIITGFFLVLVSAFRFQAPELLGQEKVLTDFDAFHIAGSMAAEGKAADTYHLRALIQAQREKSGTQSFMPWTYPPPFTLLMQGLAEFPIGVAFALFTITSFAFYLMVLHAIGGKWLPGTVIMIMPVVLLNLRTGQNGFLTAGLIGWFLVAFRDKQPVAGVPLGLMVIKPHLAVGIAVTTALRRGWIPLLAACLIVLVLLALSSWVYGISIWTDFRGAVQEAGGFLAKGYYPFFRMSSIYSTAYTIGIGVEFAMVLQAIGALLALTILGRACLSGIAYRHLAALTCGASLFVSPYGYDYDLTLLGVAFAFIMPDVLDRCRPLEVLGLLGLAWFVCGFGIGWSTIMSLLKPNTGVDLDADNGGLALISPALIALCWFTAHLIRRQEVREGDAPRRPSAGAV